MVKSMEKIRVSFDFEEPITAELEKFCFEKEVPMEIVLKKAVSDLLGLTIESSSDLDTVKRDKTKLLVSVRKDFAKIMDDYCKKIHVSRSNLISIAVAFFILRYTRLSKQELIEKYGTEVDMLVKLTKSGL